MPLPPSRSNAQIDVGTAVDPSPVALEPDSPFRILVLGDFSARVTRGQAESLASRPVYVIDIDNFDEVMQEIEPVLDLPGARLKFGEIEDFHPDHLYRKAPIFERLANLRPAPKQPPPAVAVSLEDVISRSEEIGRAASASDAEDLAGFIERVTAAHLEATPDPSKKAWDAKIRAAATEQMSAILHHPQFQALEALWRSLWMLVQRLGAEEGLRICVCDVTLAELTADPDALVEWLGASRQPWSLVVLNSAFSQTEQDAHRLSALGRAARIAGAPLLAEALPPGDASDAWESLRRSPQARWIGLTLPRFLVRLPYGRETAPVEALAYEEMPVSTHAKYLWGNPAFCSALLIGLAFREAGWDLRPGMVRRVEGLPHHFFTQDGVTQSKPCAELLMSESEAEQLLEAGYMPLASLKDQDAALLVRFCSIADPAAPLAGSWSSGR